VSYSISGTDIETPSGDVAAALNRVKKTGTNLNDPAALRGAANRFANCGCPHVSAVAQHAADERAATLAGLGLATLSFDAPQRRQSSSDKARTTVLQPGTNLINSAIAKGSSTMAIVAGVAAVIGAVVLFKKHKRGGR